MAQNMYTVHSVTLVVELLAVDLISYSDWPVSVNHIHHPT